MTQVWSPETRSEEFSMIQYLQPEQPPKFTSSVISCLGQTTATHLYYLHTQRLAVNANDIDTLYET